jgi:CheY-like chemotaxis protein
VIEDTQAPVTRSAASTKPHTILVIDDDPAILEIIAWALEDAGYTVAAVNSGREALQWIQAAEAVGEPPALILLDLAMPEMNGQQVAAALRQQWRGKRVPIVIITADLQARLRERELGAAYTLTKPFDVEGLLSIVEQFAI